VVSHGGYAGLAIPVLSPTRPYLDEQVRLTVWRLPAAAARAVLHAPLTNATAQQRFGAVPGTLVSQTVLTAAEVYRLALAQSQRASAGTTSYNGIDSGIGMGLAGSVPGATAGLTAAAVFTGSLPPQLFTAAVAGVIAGTLIATLAAVLPASLLGRTVTAQALAEE
jgi:hypothetical protein